MIRRFDYAPNHRELEIEFTTGRRYVYSDLPEREVRAMRAAFSKGRYFNTYIRDRYKCREIVSS